MRERKEYLNAVFLRRLRQKVMTTRMAFIRRVVSFEKFTTISSSSSSSGRDLIRARLTASRRVSSPRAHVENRYGVDIICFQSGDLTPSALKTPSRAQSSTEGSCALWYNWGCRYRQTPTSYLLRLQYEYNANETAGQKTSLDGFRITRSVRGEKRNVRFAGGLYGN